MSAHVFSIECTGCDYRVPEYRENITIKYQIDDEEVIESSTGRGWCYKCNKYSIIELMDMEGLYKSLINKMRNQINEYKAIGKISNSLISRIINNNEIKGISEYTNRIDIESSKIEKLIKICEDRKSNPRCIKCGSDNTFTIHFYGEDLISRKFKHECGGMLRVVMSENRYFLPDEKSRVITLNREGRKMK